MEERAVYGKFVNDVALVGAGDFLKILRTIIIIPLFAKFMGAGEYGIWTQVKASSVFFATITLLGLKYALVRFLGGEKRADYIRQGFNSCVWLVTASSLLIIALLFVFSDSLAVVIFEGPQSTYFVKVIGLLVLFDALDQLALTYFQTYRQLTTHFSYILLEVLGDIALIAGLLITGYGLASIFICLIVWKCSTTFLKLTRIWSQTGLSYPVFSILHPYIAFSLPLLIARLFYFFVNYGDRYLINFFLGMNEVGVYSIAYAVGTLPMILLTPIEYILYPTIVDHWNRGEIHIAENYIRHALKYILLIVIPVFFGLIVLSKSLILLLSTEEFLSASIPIPLISLGFIVFGLGVIGERIMTLSRSSFVITILYGGLAILNLILNYIFIPVFGILGAALATLFTFCVYTLCTTLLAYQYCRIQLERNVWWKSIIAAVLMAWLLHTVDPSSFLGLLGACLFGSGVYLGTLLILKSFSQDEVRFVKDFASSFVRG